MDKEILTFGDTEIEKNKFHCYKSLIFLEYVDTEKVLVSHKISSDEKKYKYFIGYLYNDHQVKLLHIMLPKTYAYIKGYDGQTNQMYFLIEDDDLLEKYNTISVNFSPDIKKEFDSEPSYSEFLLKTKIKSHGDEVTNFCDKEISMVDSNQAFLAVKNRLKL